LGVVDERVRAALFLDRDGVLNDLAPDPDTGLPESPLDPDDVVLMAGAADAIVRARSAGYAVVGVSNQPAAAKGTVPLGQLEAVQARVLELLAAEGATLDAMYVCFHHPDGVVQDLAVRCRCRKPEPGLLLDAAAELDLDLSASWLVGDTDSDVAAAAAAGVRAALVEHPGSVHKRKHEPEPEAVAMDLPAAVKLILGREPR
jgi:D-glycero-D-manno-heptose 1,7-bisphosphate phosphatase